MNVSTDYGGRALAAASAVLLTGCLGTLVGAGGAYATPGRCLGKVATIVGTDNPDRIIGTQDTDVIVGLGGGDVIRGGGGDDRICGGGRSDELFGGAGSDRLAGQGNQAPSGQPTFPSGDTVAGGRGDDVVFGGGPTVDGRSGDAVSFRGAADGVRVDLVTGDSHGQGDDTLVGIEDIIGSEHADVLRSAGGGEVRAGNGDDRLRGAAGRDRLLAGNGTDHLVLGAGDFGSGGAGDDVLRMKAAGNAYAVGENGADTYLGGPGPDTFYDLGPGSVGRHGDHARGGRGSDVIALGNGDDVSRGGPGTDSILAGPGPDRVDGGRGADTYSGGLLSADGFTVNLRRGTATGGGTGSDRLTSIVDLDGSAEDDVLVGDARGNVVFAGPGDDQMSGGAGDDSLDGFDGDDRADGGAGTDTCIAEHLSGCEQ